MLINKTLTEYFDVLASDSPVPGGGSALGVVCATAVSLVEMACNVTLKKLAKKGHSCPDLTECLDKLAPFRQKFIELIDEDAQAFELILEAMRLPKSTENERNIRFEAMQQAYINSATVCLSLVETAAFACEIADQVILFADEYVASDAKIGKDLLACAVRNQEHNLTANVDMIDDQEVKEHFKDLMMQWYQSYIEDEII